MKKRVFLISSVLVCALVLGFFAGFWMPRDDDFFALRKNYQIFGALYEELVAGYVDPLNPEKMMRTGIDAMLRDLDPYTNFFDEADNTDIDIITRGRYGGVGLDAAIFNGKITVVAPMEGSSAYKQGIRTGDIITQVSEQSTEDLSLKDVRTLIHGEPGTTVEITVTREGEPEPLQFILTREEVKLKNVTYTGFVNDDTLAGMGYIKLERFARGASEEVRQAVQELQDTDALQGLILDLRDNPGGLLDAAVEISQLFVPQGSLIVSTKGRQTQTERAYRGKMPPLAPDVPLAVLINGYSASASEIVAGAVQDLDRGVIVGLPSFGKGLVQIVKPLPYNTSLKFTTSRYYLPSGRSIQAIDYGLHDGNFTNIPDSLRRTFETAAGRTFKDGRGIEPDLEVIPGYASALEQALDRRAAFFFYANHYVAAHPQRSDCTTEACQMQQAQFEVTADIMVDFQQWLQGQQFTYRTAVEHTAETLVKHLEKSGYEGVDDEMEDLERAIQEQKAADFDRYTERLKERLRAEILARYVSETVQVRTALVHDVQVQKTVALLQDNQAYDTLLKP